MSIISKIMSVLVGEETEPAVSVERFQPALDDLLELSHLWRPGRIDAEDLMYAATDGDDWELVWVARYEGQQTIAGYVVATRQGDRLEILDAQPADGQFAGHLLSAMLACVVEFARLYRMNLAIELDEGSILEREVAARGFTRLEGLAAVSGVVYTLDRFES